MFLLRNVVCQIKGKGQGCPLISGTIVDVEHVYFAGGVFGGGSRGGGGGGTQNVTQNTAPWAGQQPYLSEGFGHAKSQFNTPQTFFPGQTYANFSPQTENALNMTEQRALAGSPVMRASNAELQRTLNGDYLHGGAGFNAAFQAAANKIQPMVQSGFNQGGRLNSGLSRVAETQALGDAFAGQYGAERNHQLQAMLFAPQAAQSDYQDLSALMGVGDAREDQAQLGIDQSRQKHEFEQMEPSERLARYMAMINGNYGMSGQTSSQPFRGSRGGRVFGGALGGASAGAPFGPLGAGIGAAVGGLGGLFG